MLVRRAFGFKFGKGDAISLQQARHVSSIIALRMQSTEFLKQIETSIVRLCLF